MERFLLHAPITGECDLMRSPPAWLSVAMQLQAAATAFQVQLRADGRAEATRLQYARHLASLIAWLKANDHPTSLGDITPAIVAAFFASDAARLSARGGAKKATSANAQRTSLRCFFRWAHESGISPTNAARLLKRARCAPPPPRALRDDEQERLLRVLADAQGPEARRDQMLVRLLLGCGTRIGSALALRVADVDFAHSELTLRSTKGNRPTTVVMPRVVATQLREFLADRSNGPVFRSGDRSVSVRHMQRRLASWMNKAGIVGKSAHSMRHAFAMRVYGQTGDLLTTQALLGHQSVISTCVYAKVDRDRLRAVVGA